MPVIRIEKTRDYTVMSNHHFRNRNLSLKAKGIMSLMLSLPDDWDYTIAGLAKLSKDGISSVRAALKELEDEGYLKMEQTKAENGKFGKNQYVLYEKPFTENPITEKPITENPITEKPAQLNTHISNTNISSTKESITGADAPEDDGKATAKKKEKEKDPFDVPSPQLREALKGFADSRKALHKPMTIRAKKLTLAKLEQLAPHNEVRQVAILNQSVERGWQGVFDIEQDKRYKGGGPRAAEPKADDLYNEAMGILNQ
ncbi:helix-turn-helix domain-containing protein [Mitsuokella sp.]|uniref:helix-turn-helix domain-containing protein n=1 Tax=Mitsuokella sp. TaxID=2049034 RepID=UPI003D7C9EDA